MADLITGQGPELSASFQGEAIRPEDPGYDTARAVYNGSIDRRPAVVLRPHGAADVIDAVGFARDSGLGLSVRCGGHGIAGTSVADGTVLIDLSAMKGVHVDLDRRTAVALGGTLWGEYDRETQLFGLATPGGRVTTTGIGGLHARRRLRLALPRARAHLRQPGLRRRGHRGRRVPTSARTSTPTCSGGCGEPAPTSGWSPPTSCACTRSARC